MVGLPNSPAEVHLAAEIDGVEFGWFPLERLFAGAEDVELFRSSRLEEESVRLVLESGAGLPKQLPGSNQ